MFRTPTALLVFLQGIPGCVPWGVIIVYFQDYLQADLGLSLERSAMVLTCFAIGGFGGQFVGGELGQRLYLAQAGRGVAHVHRRALICTAACAHAHNE